jgi:tRNA threonylcarbamoyladenosine biosynthesis protein TsaE
MIETLCPEEADTRALARKLAALLRPGDTVVLVGALGAGKTLFAGGLATGLGIEEDVVSPSFVLVRQYHSGFLPMIHADVYRLSSLNEFDDLNVFEMARDGVLVIEWGDAIEAVTPDDHLRVEILAIESGGRAVRLAPHGSWEQRDLGAVL